MQPHLILDEQSVAAHHQVRFELNPATRHPANPVMIPGEPHQWDSLCVGWPGTVLYSPPEKKFRCWYAGMDVVQTPDRAWHTGYAESDDGVEWFKPNLGQIEFLGRPTNRIPNDFKASFLSCVFENPLPNAPASQRFGGYWTGFRFAGDASDWNQSLWNKTLAWSADGMQWSAAGIAYGEKPRAPLLDISQLVYDPADPDPAYRWKAYGQLFRARPDGKGWPGIREIGLAHGPDVTRVVDAPNPYVLSPLTGIDEEIHFAAVQKIGKTYLMLFESDRFSKNPIHGDLRLAVSDNGRDFRRLHPRSPFLGTGAKGMWDENLLVTNSAGWQFVGDELYLHYFGCPNTFNSWPSQYAVSAERRGALFAPAYLGLATLPRDRFAFAVGPGGVTTHPLEIGPDGVWLNAEGEGIAVTATDPTGKNVAIGKLSRERRQTVYRKVEWTQQTPGGKCALQIKLTHTDRLFSFAV